MLKLNASYSKKVPADAQYSSQSYLASVEVELPHGMTTKELKAKIHETFELVKSSVEQEITRKQTPAAKPANQQERGSDQTTATNKQINYILKLGQEHGKGLPELNSLASERFKSATIYQLTKSDASKLVDELKLAA
jgi:hypothetical protein